MLVIAIGHVLEARVLQRLHQPLLRPEVHRAHVRIAQPHLFRLRVFVEFAPHGQREVSQSRQVYAVAEFELFGQLVFQRDERAHEVGHGHRRRRFNAFAHAFQSHGFILVEHGPHLCIGGHIATRLH